MISIFPSGVTGICIYPLLRLILKSKPIMLPLLNCHHPDGSLIQIIIPNHTSSVSSSSRSLRGQYPAVPRYALAVVQNPLQHHRPDVRRESHFRPARDDRAKIPRSPAAGRLRSVRVSKYIYVFIGHRAYIYVCPTPWS